MPTKHRLYLTTKARVEAVWAMTSSLWWEIAEIICCWVEPEDSGPIFPAQIKTYSLYWSRQDIHVSIQGWQFALSSEFDLFSGIDCEQFCHFHSISKYFSSVTVSKNWVLWISLTEQMHVLLVGFVWFRSVFVMNNHLVYGTFWREC